MRFIKPASPEEDKHLQEVGLILTKCLTVLRQEFTEAVVEQVWFNHLCYSFALMPEDCCNRAMVALEEGIGHFRRAMFTATQN